MEHVAMKSSGWIVGGALLVSLSAMGCDGEGAGDGAQVGKARPQSTVASRNYGVGDSGSGIGKPPSKDAQALATVVSPAAVPVAVKEPTVAPSVEPFVPNDAETSVVHIKRFVFAKGVAGREPVDANALFVENDGPVYAYLELENVSGADTEINLHWERVEGSAPRGAVTLDVGAGPRFRTWAYTRNLKAGHWFCIVSDGLGQEIGRAEVAVSPAL